MTTWSLVDVDAAAKVLDEKPHDVLCWSQDPGQECTCWKAAMRAVVQDPAAPALKRHEQTAGDQPHSLRLIGPDLLPLPPGRYYSLQTGWLPEEEE